MADCERDIEVLITGFGPFLRYSENPAWLAVKDLHDTYLETARLAAAPTTTSCSRIHLQTLQTSVCYSHVLDLIPRIHGQNVPASKESRPFLDPRGALPSEGSIRGPQGDGQSFPLGYDAQYPCDGRGTYDIVVHVGVGRPGAIAVEKVGHKRGYDKPDIRGEMAPRATDQRRFQVLDGTSEAESAESRNFVEAGLTLATGVSPSSIVRGFGQGYEQFPEELVNIIDTAALVDWLVTERGFEDIRESHDAGRFLCDFIYYCSLSEAQRSIGVDGQRRATVLFVHVPPLDRPHGPSAAQEVIKAIVSWLGTLKEIAR